MSMVKPYQPIPHAPRAPRPSSPVLHYPAPLCSRRLPISPEPLVRESFPALRGAYPILTLKLNKRRGEINDGARLRRERAIEEGKRDKGGRRLVALGGHIQQGWGSVDPAPPSQRMWSLSTEWGEECKEVAHCLSSPDQGLSIPGLTDRGSQSRSMLTPESKTMGEAF
ncbi:uncharacterized protein LOC119293807 [Triticum dicoccoides]|uniref:uncharacterized protein LOC119293807 n=1 Tax=Triticum dicoccoides TaxID=85692 RepID=UPI00188F23CB|nr:uncharacterized protein LOC119293807 [Triticum dicoccoides]